ncbi:MAG: MFS transporter [Acidimicrobiales bacterium]|jgi:EmrB/QacA subfamily drug resistance transporter|nr:MFS transporter [Acidimicrobiales bacterium]
MGLDRRAGAPAGSAEALDAPCGGDARPCGPADLVIESPGTEEIAVLPWPMLWRQRLHARATRSERYPWIVLAAALFGLFAVGFSITVLSLSISTIAEDLDSSDSTLIWVMTGPLLLSAMVVPTAGKLADLFGARRVYLLAMAGVAVFSVLSALAWSGLSLVAFRTLGAGLGSATGPASFAIINRLFPAERRAQALGYWSLVAAGGPVLGVVIGGPVVEAFGWRWIFWPQVPLVLLTLVVCAATFPDTDRVRDVRFDTLGALSLGLSVFAILFGLNRAPVWGWDDPVVVVCLVAAPLLLASFVLVERRVSHPLIPLGYFGERNFALPITNQFFANFAYMGGFYLTARLLEEVFDYSQTRAGLISIARPLTFAIAGPIAGWVTVRIGERTNGIAGAAFLAASMFVFAQVTTDTSDLVIVAALMLSGVGMGTLSPAMAAAVANAVDRRDLGVAGASQQMVSQVGVVAGMQLLVTVQQAREPALGLDASYAFAYTAGGVAALAAVAVAFFVRSTAHVPVEEPVVEPALADV